MQSYLSQSLGLTLKQLTQDEKLELTKNLIVNYLTISQVDQLVKWMTESQEMNIPRPF